MPIVAVAGLSSGVGKTRLIERLLGALPGTSVLKVSLGEEAVEPRLVTDPDELRRPGKDTHRYLEAGALRVVWIRCRRRDLAALLPQALGCFDPGLLVVESNSAVRKIDPQVVLFVEGDVRPEASGRGSPKENAGELRAAADLVTREPFHNFEQIVCRIQEVIQMSEERARELIAERAKEGKMACAQAFKIAEDAGVGKRRIGEILNEMNIKIVGCQLGCFP